MPRCLSLAPLATLAGTLLACTAAADYIWIGSANGGDGTSFFNENNWDADGDPLAPYVTPPANAVNNITQTPNFVADSLVVPSGLIGGGGGVTQTLQFNADGRRLELSGDAWLRMNVLTPAGVRRDATATGTNFFDFTLAGQATYSGQNVVEGKVTLSDQSTFAVYGADVPVANSFVDIRTPYTARLFLRGESWVTANPQPIHTFLDATLSGNTVGGVASPRLLIDGSPAVWGSDPFLLEAGDTALAVRSGTQDPLGNTLGTFDYLTTVSGVSGVWVMSVVPEPATAGLFTLGVLLLRRRK
jgi:hypothetical protein